MVTLEIAMALPALVLVMAVALWGFRVASAQLACTDAARTGARAAARGEALPSVRALIARAVPKNAAIEIHRDATTTRIAITARLTPPTKGFPPLTIHAQATTATEPGATTP